MNEELQVSINNLITKFPPNVRYAEVESTLLPILDHHSHQSSPAAAFSTADNVNDDKSNAVVVAITPLMIACDSGQTEAVRFLLHHKVGSGCCSRMDRSSSSCLTLQRLLTDQAPESLNTPMHYAAMSGKVEILEQLLLAAAFAWAQDEEKKVGNFLDAKGEAHSPDCASNISECKLRMAKLQLGSLRNAHGDTPIMMACVNGGEELLTYWLSASSCRRGKRHDNCYTNGGKDDDDDRYAKRLMLRLRNESNDSALSLACGHGQVEIVKLLLLGDDDGWNVAQQDDLVSAEASLSRIDHVLKQQQPSASNNSRLQGLQAKRGEIQQCVGLVRDALHRRADAIAQELLGTTKATAKSNRKKRPKKPNKKPQASNRLAIEPSVPMERVVSDDKQGQETPEAVALTKLRDGTRAVVVKGTSLQEENTTISLPTQKTNKSVNDLFREHLEHNEIDDLMEALCLDVSQLLMSPHGMALNLSPSQLDTVDQILERQRVAVQEARAIQARLHATAQLQRSDNGDTFRE